MRTRPLKPDFFGRADLGTLPALDRILYLGLRAMADVDGRLVEPHPALLRAKILPFDQEAAVEKMLCALAGAGAITRYESPVPGGLPGMEGIRLIQINGWDVRTPGAEFDSESRLPAPAVARDGAAPTTLPAEKLETGEKQARNTGETPGQRSGNGEGTPDGYESSIPGEIPKGKRDLGKRNQGGALGEYARAYVARYGHDPIVTRGEAVNANVALKDFTPEQRALLLRAYVADEDPFICKQAHSLGFFPRSLNRIRAKLNGKLSGAPPTPAGPTSSTRPRPSAPHHDAGTANAGRRFKIGSDA